jgi:cellulose synthase/poly-beta-1,6-N-acetylglucosamine synthase-like glycosyltransferase
VSQVLGILVLAVYLTATVFLATQGLHSLWLLWRFRRHRPQHEAAGGAPVAPGWIVLVQLPVWNERDVVERLVAAVGSLDWPRAALRIQLLDDSNDETVVLGARAVARLRAAGIDAEHVRRADRSGFKAGALAHGLALDAARADGAAPFVAIFDADFVPGPDFLRRTVPVLAADPRLAFVQARWEHLNADQSLLTRAQALGIDGHFAIEQGARAWSGLPLNFNGTCGVWRTAAIAASGGWQHDTLTEDLDLSYRAHLCGHRAAYLLATAVPGELPTTLEAWRAQQFRWAKGSLQTARKLLPTIWRASWPTRQKVAATLHLTHYLVHPAIVVSMLLSPLAAWYLRGLPAVALACGLGLLLAGLVPPLLLYWQSQRVLRRPWRTLLALPTLMSLGTGLALNNARAAWQALRGSTSPFVRTPKSGATGGSYRAAASLGIGELGLGCYGLLGCNGLWSSHSLWLMPAVLLYAMGFLVQGAILLAHRLDEAFAANPRPTRSLVPLVSCGVVALAAVGLLVGSAASWRERPLWFAGWGTLSGLACLLGFLSLRQCRIDRRSFAWILAVGIGLQVLATGLPLSDDVQRYAMEGAQLLHGQNPYAVAPERAGLSEVSAATVNHADMTSIYPPLMLWVHRGVMSVWPAPVAFKLLGLLATAALTVLVLGLLLIQRRSPALLLLLLWNPALTLFTAGEAHHDAVMAAAVVAALLALAQQRPRSSVLLATVAMLLKPFAGLALPFLLAATSWRRLWIPVLATLFAFTPFLAAGQGLTASLLTFGGSMQFHGALEPYVRWLCAAVLPESAVALAVRIVLATGLLSSLWWLSRRSRNEELASRLARAVALLLLFLPTLHPWYFTLLVALLPFVDSVVLVAWTAAAPLYWLHGVGIAPGQQWGEWHWAAVLAHAPFCAWMLAEAAQRSARRLAERTAGALRTDPGIEERA